MNSLFREFSSKGRLSRGGHAIRMLIVIVLVLAVIIALIAVLAITDVDTGTVKLIAFPTVFALMLFCHFYGTAIGIRRCHDIGNAGDALYSISTAFKRGDVGPNEYGPDPLGDSNQQKIS